MTDTESLRRRFLVEDSCEHGFFGKHVTDYDPAGSTYCLSKPVVVTTEELLAMLVAKGVLEREWRCWREDGSYYGPCDEQKIANWKAMENRGWFHRHETCGWQLSAMEVTP